MMRKFYSFAGVDICLESETDHPFDDSIHLAAFQASAREHCHKYTLSLVPQLDAPVGNHIHTTNNQLIYRHSQGSVCYHGIISGNWESATTRVDHRGQIHHVQLNSRIYKDRLSEKAILNALGVENLVAQAGGFILHASYIVYNGMGILFTAPSGTGKSTQAELWHKFRDAQIVNGDRAVVRLTDGSASVWGFPFCGSSSYCHNVTAPLAAIVYLSQAPQTTIQKLRGYQAFRYVWEGVNVHHWDPENVALVSKTTEQLLQQVPVYHLACTPDESAVSALEKTLTK